MKTVQLHISACVFFVLLFALPLRTQTMSTKGTDFYFTYMQNSDPPEMWVFVSADVATTAQVFVGATLQTTLSIAAGNGVSYRVVLPAAYQTTSGIVRPNSAVRVVSQAPVTVYAFNTYSKSTDACIVLPKHTLADEYIIASSPFYTQFGTARSEAAIVGVDGPTIVEITPKAPVITPSGTQSAAYTITLNAGDVYQFQTQGVGTDLTGTRVRVLSNSGPCGRVAVFSGHQRTAMPTSYTNNRDHLLEQMPPIRTLGKSFIVPPLFTATKYSIRVIASEPSTIVTIDGTPTTLTAIGSFVERTIPGVLTSSVITSNRPVLVVQYAFSLGQGFAANGDPFMTVVPPIEQLIDRYTFNAFVPPNAIASDKTAFRNNLYVNVIARTVDIENVTFDGVPISVLRTRATPPRRVAGAVQSGGMSYAIIQVTEGVHVVNASSGEGSIGLIYGLAPADSYGFAGGTSVTNLRAYARIIDTLACPGRPTLLEAFSLDSNAITTYQWIFPFDGTTLTGKRVQKSFPDTGTYTVLLNLLKGGCTLDTVATEIRIETPVKPVLTVNRSPECWNTPITIQAAVNGTPGPYTYLWAGITQNGIVSGSTDSVVTVRHAAGGTYRYRVTVTDGQGCTGKNEVDVVVLAGPDVAPSDNILVCVGDTVDVPALVAGNGLTFSWTAVSPLYDGTIIGSRVQQTLRVTSDTVATMPYTVRVTDANGCFDEQTYRVEVVDKPVIVNNGGDPVIRCLEASVPPVTIGDSIVITGGKPPYTYSWTEAGGGTTTITGPTNALVTTVKPSFTTTYVLTVRDSENRISCPVEFRITVQVRLVPDATAGPDRIICLCSNVNGASIGELALCGRPPYQYTWTPTTGLSNPTSTVTGVTQANPAQTTTYILTVQDADGGSNSDTVTVFVEPCPEVTIPDVTMCDGTSSVQLKPVVTIVDADSSTYSWTPTTFLSDPSVRDPIVAAQDSTYELTYTLTVTSNKGCMTSADVVVRRSFDLRAIVSATPECSVDTICRGDTVLLTVEGLGGRAPYTYAWSAVPPDATIDAQGDGTARAQPLTQTTYTATVRDAYGCEATNIVVVCVDPVPNAFAGEDTTICLSDAGVVPIIRGKESSCGKLPFVYQWAPVANVVIPNTLKPWEADLRPTQTTLFILRVQDDGGAGASTLDTIIVTVRPPILITFDPDTVDICKGIPEGALTAVASNGNSPYQYEWIVNGNVVVTDITAGPSLLSTDILASFTQSTFVHVRVTDSLGCESEDSMRVVVREAPVVQAEPLYQICPCDSVQIGALATGGTPFTDGSYRYKWYEINEEDQTAGSISNDTIPQPWVHPRSNTSYVVVATDSAGCSSAPFTVMVIVDRPGSGTTFKPADIVVDPRTSSVSIPITTPAGQDSIACMPDRIEFSFSYDERLYDPAPTVNPGTILDNTVTIVGGIPIRTIRIRIVPSPPLTVGSTITTVKGKALVGEPGFTQLLVSNAQMIWPCTTLPILADVGTLTLDSLCEKPDGTKRLLAYTVSTIQSVEPNPTDGVFNISILRGTSMTSELVIVNEIGVEIHRIEVPGSPVEMPTTIRIPLQLQVPNGVYRALLHSSSGVSVHSFMVIR